MRESFSFKPEDARQDQGVIMLGNNLAAVFEKIAERQEDESAAGEAIFAADEMKEMGGFFSRLAGKAGVSKKTLLVATFALSVVGLSEAWAGGNESGKTVLSPAAQKSQQSMENAMSKMKVDFVNELKKEMGEAPISYNSGMTKEQIEKEAAKESEKAIGGMMSDFADALDNF